ncbi:uncharacterized protein V1513DRAFT_380436 [Lipomyces chichibuensis]|uniref:uncharacterized protein n=1 Tax=Lipomyces chichibuensis TaxID=1546026 RepID=UPI0033436E76
MSISSSASQRPLEVDIKKQFSWTTPDAVWAIAQFQQYSLAYAAGSKVYLKTLNVETLKFEPNPAEITIRSPAVNLSSDGDLIYASTRNNSVVVLAYRNNSLVFVESDAVARSMLHHQVYMHDFVVGADKDRAIFGLYSHRERRHFSNMALQFKFVLPTAVSRLRLGRFVPVRDHPDIDDGRPFAVIAAEDSSVPDPQFEDIIVGAGINGSVYGIRILSQEEYQKLSYHLRRVVREICRHYRRQRRSSQRGLGSSETSPDAGKYPLGLGLIPKEFGISQVLVDSNLGPHGLPDSEKERERRRRRMSADLIDVPSDQLSGLAVPRKSPSETSLRHIDGDVFIYLNNLLLHLRSLSASNIEPTNSHPSSAELQDPSTLHANTQSQRDNDGDVAVLSENSVESKNDEDSLYNDSSESSSHYYRFSASMADDESHLQSQEWINRIVNGIVL